MTTSLPGESAAITRILLADDHEPYRLWLRACLSTEPHIQVVAEARDGRAALRLVEELKPDVVIMDLAMPHVGGIEATRLITEHFPTVKVLALSMHRYRSFVEAMLAAGASGYVLKEHALLQLHEALRTVAGGATYLSPELG